MDERRKSCSVCRRLQVVSGNIEDYEALSRYHYRDSQLGPFAAIFALRGDSVLTWQAGLRTIGVITYTMPTSACQLRNTATDDIFAGLDRDTRLTLINKNIRRISRVIIEPRFRSLGLAARLVSETMPLLNVPIIEAMAVMGLVNPFFEKANMKAFTAKTPARCAQLIEALSCVGMEEHQLIDAECVQRRLDNLPQAQADFIELEIKRFLQSYGKRRTMPPGLERTRYILSKLTERPVYYIWFNKNLELKI